VATTQNPKPAPVSAKSLEEVLEALKDVADALAANTAAIAGSGGGNGSGNGNGSDNGVRQPTVTQARSILDYLVVSQLLSRIGFVGRVVQARREANKLVRLRNVPTEIEGKAVVVKFARVTPRFGAAETAELQDSSDPDPGLKFFRLVNIEDDTEIVRIELQDRDGVPVALGPRLAPLTNSFGGGGADVD
jgi:hypothetical protein